MRSKLPKTGFAGNQTNITPAQLNRAVSLCEDAGTKSSSTQSCVVSIINGLHDLGALIARKTLHFQSSLHFKDNFIENNCLSFTYPLSYLPLDRSTLAEEARMWKIVSLSSLNKWPLICLSLQNVDPL